MATRGSLCVRCGYSENLIPIELEKCSVPSHSLCCGCLKINFRKYGDYTCPECSTDVKKSKVKPIWLFVDDSNIWIEAKKVVSKLKGFKTKEDRRLRIDVGKLTDVVTAGRPVKEGILYGSEPPKIDSVWEKIRKKNFVVKTKRKSIITRREKEVDGQLITDVTAIACKTPEEERSTIILITGDADIRPAVERIIQEGVWSVEIYMWRQGFSRRLKDLEKESEKVRCSDLDEHLNKITFTNWSFEGEKVPKDHSVVLTMKHNAFPKRVPPKKWWIELESIAQWPMTGMWLTPAEGKETDFYVIVFDYDQRHPKNTFDVARFVHELTKMGNVPLSHVIHAETYFEHMRRMSDFKSYNLHLVGYGTIKQVDCEDLDQDDTQSESSFVMDEGEVVCYKSTEVNFSPLLTSQYQIVEQDIPDHASLDETKFTTVPPRHVTVHPKECQLGKNCRRGLKCVYKHSDDDKNYFDRRENKEGNPFRKVGMCKNYEKQQCRHSLIKCDYAHGKEDAWCLNCRITGHFTENCHNN